MAQTISELEKERAELLKAIQDQAQHISSSRTTESDLEGHTLKDWLNAAEEVMPNKTESNTRNTQSTTQSSAAASPRNKASFFGVIILLSLLLTILGVLYIAYSTVNSELKEVQEVKKISQDETVQLQASMNKLEESIATGGTPERFVALEQRVMELEAQLEMIQTQQLDLLARLDKTNLNPVADNLRGDEAAVSAINGSGGNANQAVTESILDRKLQAYTSGLESRIDEKLSMILDVLMKGDVQSELKDKVLLNGDTARQPEAVINQPIEPVVTTPRIKQPLVKMVESIASPSIPAVSEPKASYSEDVKWLLAQPEQHYILQLASMTDKQALLKMINQKGLKDSRIVEQTRDSSMRYVLVYGSYVNRNEANQMAKKIKAQFGIAPWVRKMKDLTSKLP